MGSKRNDVDALMFSLKDDDALEKYFSPELEETIDNQQILNEESNEQSDGEIDAEKINELDSTVRPGLSKRLFGKLEAGSIRGSIFSMIILSLGTGCLSLPKIMADMSLVMGLLSICLTGIATYWTLWIVTLISEKHKIFNYSKLTRKIFGNAVGFILDFTIMFYIFGILILYQVVIFKTIGEVVYNFGEYFLEYKSIELFLKDSFWNNTSVKLMVMYGVTVFFIAPLCLLKDVSKLRMASLLGVCTLIFLIILIIVQCPFYIQYYWDEVYSEGDPNTYLNIFNVASGFDSNLYFFQGTASLFYSYTCHLGAFPIFNSLKNNAMRRIHKVISRTLILDFVFFVVISICGYLTWPINTPSLIIGRDNIAGGVDIIMSIGRIALVIMLIMKLPNSYNAFRISFFEMVFGDSKITNKRNWLLTIPTLFITVIIAILYDQVLGYIKLLGGFCSTFLGYVMPGLIYVKANDYPLSHWKNITTLILILLCATIGFTSGTLTLIGMFSGKNH